MSNLANTLKSVLRFLIAALISWLALVLVQFGVEGSEAALAQLKTALEMLGDLIAPLVAFAIMAFIERKFGWNIFGVKRPGDVQ